MDEGFSETAIDEIVQSMIDAEIQKIEIRQKKQENKLEVVITETFGAETVHNYEAETISNIVRSDSDIEDPQV